MVAQGCRCYGGSDKGKHLTGTLEGPFLCSPRYRQDGPLGDVEESLLSPSQNIASQPTPQASVVNCEVSYWSDLGCCCRGNLMS